MSKYHAVSSGVITKAALPSITRQRGTTTVNANLLLYGAGKTTVSNNTTFIDSSSNAFTITRNGDTVQSGFNPFSQASAGSGYFDGTGDYLSNGAANLTVTGDITVEFWAYLSSASGYDSAINIGNEATGRWFFGFNNGAPVVDISGTGTTTFGSAVSINTWYHIAFVRSSNTVSCYVNGVSVGTPTSLTGTVGNTSGFYVGASSSATNTFQGYISNLRIVASAVYTSNFTPPTSPLTAISGTSLLLLMDNYSIVNSSSTSLPVTIFGNTTISTAQYPTGMSSSIYFDGNGDYVTLPDNAVLNMGTSDFTIECYIYLSAAPSTYSQILNKDGKNAVSWPQYALYVNSSYKINLSLSSVPNAGLNPTVLVTGATTLSLNTWYHVAATRSGTSATLWVNGVSDGTSSSVPTTLNNGARALYVGWEERNSPDTTFNFPGYISNMRIIKGSVLYTASFTPPSAPLSLSPAVPTYVTNNIYGVNQIP